MVMMENDEQLIEQFLAPARQEIEDKGFTHSVMQRLPKHRSLRATQWLDVVGFVLVVGLFIALDGVELLWNALREACTAAIEHGLAAEVDPKSLVLAGIVLLFLTYKKIASLA